MQCPSVVGDGESLALIFSEEIKLANSDAGNYVIATAGGVDHCTSSAPSECNVVVLGNTVYAQLTSLTVGTTYKVTIPSGGLTDLAGNSFVTLDTNVPAYSPCRFTVSTTAARTSGAPTAPTASLTKATATASTNAPLAASKSAPSQALNSTELVWERRSGDDDDDSTSGWYCSSNDKWYCATAGIVGISLVCATALILCTAVWCCCHSKIKQPRGGILTLGQPQLLLTAHIELGFLERFGLKASTNNVLDCPDEVFAQLLQCIYGKPQVEMTRTLSELYEKELSNLTGSFSSEQQPEKDPFARAYSDMGVHSTEVRVSGSATLAAWTARLLMGPGSLPVVCAGRISGSDTSGIFLNGVERRGLEGEYEDNDSDLEVRQCAVLQGPRNQITHEPSINLLGTANTQMQTIEEWSCPEALESRIREASVFYVNCTERICTDTAMYIAKHAADENKIFCCDLSCSTLNPADEHQYECSCLLCKNEQLASMLLPYADILFGNEPDILAARDMLPALESKEVHVEGNVHCCLGVDQIAEQFVADIRKVNTQRKRIVFVRQINPSCADGNEIDPVTVCASESGILRIVSPIPPQLEGLLSVCGGGEAIFAGAILAQLVASPASYETAKELCMVGVGAVQKVMYKVGSTFKQDFAYIPNRVLDQHTQDMNELIEEYSNPAFAEPKDDDFLAAFEAFVSEDDAGMPMPGVPMHIEREFERAVIHSLKVDGATKTSQKRRKRGRRKGEEDDLDNGMQTCIVCKQRSCICNL